MKVFVRKLGILLTCCILLVATKRTYSSNGKRNVLLHTVVKKILGFKDSPSTLRGSRDGTNASFLEVPKYMKDLYEKYKNKKGGKGQLKGNTVRSIHAEIGIIEGESFFIFNVSSVTSTEKLLGAEIHLYRRKPKHSQKRNFRVILHEIAPSYLSQTGDLPINSASYGWQWYDVTQAVSSCLAAKKDNTHLFAINFRQITSNGSSKAIPLRRVSKDRAAPFLIVYTNDSDVVSFDNIDTLSGGVSASGARNDVTKYDTSKKVSYLPSKLLSPVRVRRKRSLLTNEIPEDPVDYKRFYKNIIPQTHPGMLQTRKESRHKLSDSMLIPYPKKRHHNRRRKKRKHKKFNRNRKRKSKRKHNNRLLPFPPEWQSLKHNRVPGLDSGELCGRRKLVVDFADIGWREWIISPASFEAHYCAGSCPFPLTKKLRPSNHATIQSIVHAIGIYPDVPAPCCVPDVMSSVTLLYFDENRNVVLKNYPSMTVETCACR